MFPEPSAGSTDLPLLLRLRQEAAALEFELGLIMWGRALQRASFNPNQPRVPAGSSEGGQWASGDGGGDSFTIGDGPVRLADNSNTRNDAPPSFVPRPDRFGWHDYLSGPHEICPVSLNCSKSQMVDYLSRFAFPGQNPNTPTANKDLNFVRDPWYGLPAGWVMTTITDDGLTVINETAVAHVLYDGVIYRTAIQNPNGSWGIATHGFGNNWIPFMDRENRVQGPKIFEATDQAMRAYILRDHGGSKAVANLPRWRRALGGELPGNCDIAFNEC